MVVGIILVCPWLRLVASRAIYEAIFVHVRCAKVRFVAALTSQCGKGVFCFEKPSCFCNSLNPCQKGKKTNGNSKAMTG